MAKYPKVYGHCDAGCKRRVPTYDEFTNSASLVEVTGFDGVWISGEKKYRIYSTNDGASYDVKISVSENGASAMRYKIEFANMVGFAFQEYFDFELVRNYLDGSAFVIEYKVNGELKKFILDDYMPHDIIEHPILFIENATRLLQHNDGTIVVQGGEDGFSPKVTVKEIEGGHRVRITDELGAHDFDVMDGQNDVFIVNITGDDENGYTADCSYAKIYTEATVNKKVIIARLENQVFYLSRLAYSVKDTIDFISADVGDSVEVTRLRIRGDDISDNPAVMVETVEGGQGGGTGKSAYEYAKEGGYTGTESEFSEMLAGLDEYSVVIVNVTGNDTDGYTADMTFDEILSAERGGKTVCVSYDGNVYYLNTTRGDFSRIYVSVGTHSDSQNNVILDVSKVVLFNNGGVSVFAHEFESNDGVSPIVSVTEIDGGHRITITDAEGDKTIDVMDGTDGYTPVKGKDYFDGITPVKGVDYFDGKDGTTPKKGEDYFDGVDGVSPIVSVSDITGGHRISITDKSGTKTVDVLNGAKGDSGRGINSVARTSGTGAAGTTDTYTITYTDNTTSTFTVYNGKNGSNGTSVTIKSVSDSTVDGGSNIVTFSDGNTLTVKNGSKGSAGTSVTVSNVTNSSADGGNNVVTFSDGKSLTVKNGTKGSKGDTGKTAYSYAQDGGYTGTEEEFSAMLAGDVIPTYWDSHLTDKIATIKALQDAGGKDCFSFIVLSDIHYSDNLGKRSPVLAKRIMDECNIRFALTLGDYQSRGSWSNKADAMSEFGGVKSMFTPLDGRVLFQQGNHDGSWGNAVNGVTYPNNFTPSELYNRIHALTYAHADAVTDESGTGYYVDDKARKVRYVMLNSQNNKYETDANGAKYNNMRVFRFTQSQYDFLVDKALKVEDGWKIVVAAHAPISNAYGELFNGGEAQSAKGDHTMMRGLLTAYRNKKAYSDSWNGTAGAGVAYTNLANPSNADSSTTANLTNWKTAVRVNSSKAYATVSASDKANQQITNLMEIGGNNQFHIRGMNVYDAKLADGNDFNRVILTNASGTVLATAQLSSSSWSKYISTASYDSNVSIVDVAGLLVAANNSSITHVRFGGYTTDKDAVVITRDENIDDNNVLTGYDAVSVNADFTSYKGELVGYFAGHTHNDNTYTYTDWGIPIITTRCDGASENVSTLLNERVAGTVTEQSFDVFTINTNKRKIYATKIGAGTDRVIDY